jgi:hypothetical protein
MMGISYHDNPAIKAGFFVVLSYLPVGGSACQQVPFRSSG